MVGDGRDGTDEIARADALTCLGDRPMQMLRVSEREMQTVCRLVISLMRVRVIWSSRMTHSGDSFIAVAAGAAEAAERQIEYRRE